MFPELIDQSPSRLPEEINLMAFLSSCESMWPIKSNRDRSSPAPDKRARSFGPCSPMPCESLMSTATSKHIALCQTPTGRPFSQFENEFGNLEIPAMYGSDNIAFSPLKRSIPFFQPIHRMSVTAHQLDFTQCNEEEDAQKCTTPDHKKKTSNRRKKLSKQISMMNTPSITTNTPQKPSIFQQNSRHSFDHQREDQIMIEQDQAEDDENVPQHSRTKGLRTLSSSVRDIVFSLKKTTYKQVAHQLIQVLLQKGLISANSKDEQNVKRRVYDALNVLIAANVLRKQGKNVIVETIGQLQGNKPVDLVKQKDTLQRLINEKEKSMVIVLERARVLSAKLNALKKLTARNKSFITTPKQRITFPFIGITYKAKSNKNKIDVSRKKVSVLSQEPFETLAETDALVLLYWNGKLDIIKEGESSV